MTCVCSKGCGRALGKRNLSGMCRPCRARDILGTPEAMAKAKAGINRYMADPQNCARRAAESAENLARWRATPEGRVRLLANAHKQLEKARLADNEERKRRIRAAAHPGVPEHRWDEVVELAKSFGSAEAKRIVITDERLRERKRRAALTPFERQQEAIARGASLVPAFKPRAVDPEYTLGGVADLAA